MRIFEPRLGTTLNDAIREAIELAKHEAVILVFNNVPVAVRELTADQLRQLYGKVSVAHAGAWDAARAERGE